MIAQSTRIRRHCSLLPRWVGEEGGSSLKARPQVRLICPRGAGFIRDARARESGVQSRSLNLLRLGETIMWHVISFDVTHQNLYIRNSAMLQKIGL